MSEVKTDLKYILIIDESKSSFILAEYYFKQFFSNPLLTASSLSEAKHILDQYGEQISWIVSDLKLGDVPIQEILEFLNQSQIKSVILTGSYSKDWRSMVLSHFIVEYFIKQGRQDYFFVAQFIHSFNQNQHRSIDLLGPLETLKDIHNTLLSQNFAIRHHDSASQYLLKKESDQPPELIILAEDNATALVKLLEHIRQVYPTSQTSIICVLTHKDRDLISQILKAGSTDFFVLPLSREEINGRIRGNLVSRQNLFNVEKILSIKNQLLGNTAHDIKSPLSVLKSGCEMLLSPLLGPLNEEQTSVAEQMSTALNHTLSLLEQLLQASLSESNTSPPDSLQPIEFIQWFQQVLNAHKVAAQDKNVHCVLNTPSEPLKGITIEASPMHLRQVIDNLLDYAINESPAYQEVHITLKTEPPHLTLSVRDFGKGIAPKDLPNIFHPFMPLAGEGKPTAGKSSTRLGMSVVKDIVDAYQWDIQVDSDPDQGTCFTLTLPFKS